MTEEEQLQEKVLARLDLSREIGDDELTELIFQVLDEESAREYIPLQKKAELGRELFNAFRKLDLLQDLIEDEEITEIMINGTQRYLCGAEGEDHHDGQALSSRSRLEDVIQQIVAGANRMVNESVPIAGRPAAGRLEGQRGPLPGGLKRPGW